MSTLKPILFALPALLLLLSLTAQAAPTADYDPNELSYGLYWFASGSTAQKFVPGATNPYFDPSKPTLIFVHGWQPGLSGNMPDFMFDGIDTVAAWIADGWNVGIFVWNQFSDETGAYGGTSPGVTDAEAKIWTPNGPQKMRWRDWDNPLGYGVGPTDKCAADLFYDTYIEALSGYTGTIRIAGHSLGSQMAVRLTKLVNDGIAAGTVPESLRPARVALLDPYWSPAPRTDLTDGDAAGRRTGDVIRDYIAELLPTGTLFEWYWSSNWTVEPDGYSNPALKPMVMYAAMNPAYVTSDMDKHMAAQHLYFWSYAFDGPAPCTGDDCLNMTRPLSRMSDEQLAAVMRSDYRWVQVEGSTTATPADDVYTSTQQANAPYLVTTLQANTVTPTVGTVVTITAAITGTGGAAPTTTLVSFSTDRGTIAPRAAADDGLVTVHLTSNIAGTAHISATTQGSDGAARRTLTITFTNPTTGCTAITGTAIVGPVGVGGTLYIGSLYTFDALITPTNASPPITYTWTPTPVNGQNHSDAAYRWETPGTYTIALTATNCGGSVAAPPRTVTVAPRAMHYIYLPLVIRNE